MAPAQSDSPFPPGAGIDDCWNRIGVRGDRSCPKLATHVHCRNCEVYASAAARLLDRPPPPGYVAEATRHFAQEKRHGQRPAHAVIVFRVAAEWLALSAAAIAEIASTRVIHSLPHRRDQSVLGLANVRGELLVCVSLARLLGLDAAAGPADTGTPGRLLIAQHAGGRLAVPVDEIYGVHRFNSEDAKPLPAALATGAATHTRATLACEQRVVGWLDEARLFATMTRNLA